MFNDFIHSSRNVVMLLAPPEKKGNITCSGNFSKRRKLPFYCSFVRFELSISHFDQEEISLLMHFPVIVECLAWRMMNSNLSSVYVTTKSHEMCMRIASHC